MSKELTAAQARRALIAKIRRGQDSTKVDFHARLFPQQRAFVEDPAKLKAAVCSRRAGKSEGVAHLVLNEMLDRGNVSIPFIALTTAQGKRILWPVLRRLDHELKLGLKFNENDLTCKAPNGSEVFIRGGSEASELERLRGGKYPLVVIDEAQSYGPHLRTVIKEIVEPAVMDYDGTIALTGTPNASCSGYFFDLTNGRTEEKASVHRWTAYDNPWPVYDRGPRKGERIFPDWIARIFRERNWTDQTPVYQREYLGKWVKDDDSLIYRIRPFNLIKEMPEVDDLSYILGMDFGFVDSTAFCVLAYSVATGRAYVVESYSQAGLIPTAVAAHVEALMERFDFDAMIGDAGGLGKPYVETLKQTMGLNVQAAKKLGKNAHIEFLNGDLLAGVMMIVEPANPYLIHEASLAQWKASSLYLDSDGKPTGRANDTRKIEDPSYSNHILDAWLYAHHYCRPYLFEGELNLPLPGTPEYVDLQQEAITLADEEAHRKASTPWWSLSESDEADLAVYE